MLSKVRDALLAREPLTYLCAAHQDLYLYTDALHCDISENNIMARDTPNSSCRRGLLIDLDSAVVVSGTPKVGPVCGLRVRWSIVLIRRFD